MPAGKVATTVLHVGGLSWASEKAVAGRALGRRPGVRLVEPAWRKLRPPVPGSDAAVLLAVGGFVLATPEPAAAVFALTGWARADAVASQLIGALILPRTWKLLRETVDVLMEATP